MGIFSTERNLYFFILNCLATCVECAHGVSGHLVKCLKFPGGNERPQCCYKTFGIFSTERNLLFFILNCPATSVECAHGVSGHLVKCLKFHWGNKKLKCSYKTMGIFSMLRNFLFFILNGPATSVECAQRVSGHLVKFFKFPGGQREARILL